MKAGYEKYKGDYFSPEKRTVLQLTFSSVEEAEKARDRIVAGTDFLAIAKERGVSEADATFADKTLGDFFDQAIADAAFKLAEGALSEPVKGSLSTALLKATKVSPEHQKTLDEVKEELSQRLKLERAREEIQSVYDAVEDARAAQTKFEDIAAKANIPFQLVPLIDATGRDKDGKDIELPQKAELLKAAFASDVGVENDAISVEDTYVWYEVREVVPSAVKPLDTVREQVMSDIVATKVRELSLDKAKKLVERARGGGTTLESLATESGATMQTAQGLKRGETSAEFGSEAVNALFAEPQDGFAYALEGDGKGARVMQSQAVLLPPFDEKSDEAKSISSTLQSQTANDLLAAYLNTLQKEAGVSINDALWRQISGTVSQ
jgi:peptidyl-prolyl cis-trans isomerase D